jgi:imidazolonepropionase
MSATLWHNARIWQGPDPGAILVRDGRIEWIGADAGAAFPNLKRREAFSNLERREAFSKVERRDLKGAWVTPGLVDCHTHIVYAGNRADEFARRLEGASYEEIARAGGGINSTVRATREASEEELLEQSARRLECLLAEGVTAIEIKSGYGLDYAAERKMLRVATRLGAKYPVTVYRTFLGAHALPKEFAGRADGYIDSVCEDMMPKLHDEGLIDAVDAFTENIGFTVAQTERVFEQAAKLGLPVRLHAEQLSNMGATPLAARYNALSSDHLEYLDEPGVLAMKRAGVTAVLLPFAFYFLREKQLPPIELLRRHGVPIALATDSNPGTSPVTSILQILNMAATLFRMTPAEALDGITRNGARALGKSDVHGALAAGRMADFCVWDIDSPAELAYWSGRNPCRTVVRHGFVVRGQ